MRSRNGESFKSKRRKVRRDVNANELQQFDDNTFGDKRISSYRREGILIPERSIDTRDCDDFTNLQECDVRDSWSACFECIESRVSLRVCAHFDHDTPLFDDTLLSLDKESQKKTSCYRKTHHRTRDTVYAKVSREI